LLSSDVTLSLNTAYLVDTTAARTLTLPSLAVAVAGSSVTVQDQNGLSQTNPILVRAMGSDQINGVVSGSYLLENNSGSLKFIVGPAAASWYIAL
jgi:hypothetical protein